MINAMNNVIQERCKFQCGCVTKIIMSHFNSEKVYVSTCSLASPMYRYNLARRFE